ncbi:MAG: LamG-like jellyroll fold domain-containing protein, partial [Phycisphaerae bacterium]
MLVFRVDEQNFGEGERDGVRIVAGQGLKVDFDELVPDGQTLGLWHLHDGACQGEGTGLADASGAGHHLTNHGAEPVEDGYRFVLADGDYMDAAFVGQPARSAITLECWVRDYAVPIEGYGYIARFLGPDTAGGENGLNLYVRRRTDPAQSVIYGRFYIDGALSSCTWIGVEVDALLASSSPFHAALVRNGTSEKLFVGGIQRATATPAATDWPAGDWTLWVGARAATGTTYNISAVLDEVRLSASARYTANFTPHRLLPSGACACPTLDAVRIQADWLDVLSEQQVPEGCAISWDVRAADETDAFGHPQALWQPYTGDPATLPDGRYFQWRATLSASGDRFTSPTLTAVEAQASEAGYDLYGGAGAGPEAIDYA